MFKKKVLESKNLFLVNGYQQTSISLFNNFFSPRGLLLKNRIMMSKVITNLNYSLYYNNTFLSENYPHVK